MVGRWIKKYSLLFIIGAVGYAAIEVIWRGRTHWSMMLAGGLCFVIFSLVARRLRGRSILIKAAVCAIGVTAVELIFGVVINLWLGLGVWDYSSMPMNILGQICLPFTLLWGGIAILFLPLAEVINEDYK